MTIFIDFRNDICFILSPKCGTQTLSTHLKLPLDISYNTSEIESVLENNNYKKIIIIRDVIDRFFSGFYEDLRNNKCYLDLNISFFEYIEFIYFCKNNKIKNVNNLNVYYQDKNKLIEWGNCSNSKFPITDSYGNLSGHIVEQKIHLYSCVELLNKDDNVEIIDISELNKITNIRENSKIYDIEKDCNYDCNTLLCDLKKNNVYPKKEKMLNSQIKNMINHMYMDDIEYINEIKQKFSKIEAQL